jgi:hypothetical protein
MNRIFSIKKALFFLIIPALFVSCEISFDGDFFDYDLRGTWVSTYGEEVKISMDTIKITPSYYYAVSVLEGFTTGYLLEGYSEKLSEGSYREHRGNLIIKDMGNWRSVPYLLWKEPHTGTVLLTIGDLPGNYTPGNYTTFEKQ